MSKKKSTKKKKVPVPASPRSTSGIGYVYEDMIAGWLLVKALTGECIPGIEAPAVQIQWQTDALGWKIDDLLVTGKDANGQERRLALSVKANSQVTGNGWPADFVESIWSMWQDSESPVNRTNDVIGLAIPGPQPMKFREAWRDIKGWWASEDSSTLISRMRAKNHQKVFSSLQVNTEGNVIATPEEAAELVGHLTVLELDFQSEPSNAEAAVVAECQRLLQSGDLEEARNLWQRLLSLSSERRTGSGIMTLSELIRLLREDFRLKDHISYASSWEALKLLSTDWQSRIQTSLSSGYEIDRSQEADAFFSKMETDRALMVIGEAGAGKSALVKSVLNRQFAEATQIWLGPEDLELALQAAKRTQIGLQYDLDNVLNSTVTPQNVLVMGFNHGQARKG